jgi:2-dehydropantoate 2-reductase
MKVMIVGAGVIGTIYGWALSGAGHSVIHLIRSDRVLRFTNGISIDMMDRRKGHQKWYAGIYNIQVTEILNSTNDFDMVIVPVRHYSIIDVLKQIVPLTPHANYLLLSQNWKGTIGIDDILDKSRYVLGDAKAGGSFQNNKLVATIYAIDIGHIENKHNDCLKKAQDLFQSADIKTTLQDNILHYLWVQYAITGGMWPAFVQAGSLKAVLKNHQLTKSSISAVKECLTVVKVRGVDLKKYNETDIYFTGSIIKQGIGTIVIKIIFRLSKYIQRNSAHAMADPEEIKTFYYDLINTGSELGINMPVMISFKKYIDKL